MPTNDDTNDAPKAWEGPWTDETGRPCLGIWADEGGVLLVLRLEAHGGFSFHHAQAGEESVCSLTISSFRVKRIQDFFSADTRQVGLRDLRAIAGEEPVT